jgi:CheY-like chemotaxis protein
MMQERVNCAGESKVESSSAGQACGRASVGVVRTMQAGLLTMQSDAPVDRGSASIRVLICDDETRLVALTAGLLREFGYEVLAVANGESAVERVKHEPVDIVILDVNLPGEDTLAVARKLIENNAPAIVLSSGFTEEDVEADLLALPGVRAFLAKPYSIEALSATIRRVVNEVAGTG